jgi:hypothetical protein
MEKARQFTYILQQQKVTNTIQRAKKYSMRPEKSEINTSVQRNWPRSQQLNPKAASTKQ